MIQTKQNGRHKLTFEMSVKSTLNGFLLQMLRLCVVQITLCIYAKTILLFNLFLPLMSNCQLLLFKPQLYPFWLNLKLGHFDCHLTYVINDHCLQMKCFYKPIIALKKKNGVYSIHFMATSCRIAFFCYGSKGEQIPSADIDSRRHVV